MDSPRKCFAEISPITQRTASMMLDFPHPLGPTTPVKLLGKVTVVGSTKDLKPAILSFVKRIFSVTFQFLPAWTYRHGPRLGA
jgi:hypothetical protein